MTRIRQMITGIPLYLWLGMVMGIGVLPTVQASEPAAPISNKESGSVWQVRLDGTGHFISIQEAIDQAGSGDTILIAAGSYAEDVTVHSKEGLVIIGEGMDKVILTGKKRVGTLHIGKWPYGATNVTIRGLTVLQHGGLGVGIFNGSGVFLQQIRVKGMVFSQQVQNVRMEDCVVGESETSGIAFADSSGTLTGNLIHNNDHGVVLGGKSRVQLERNVITKSLFEAVQMADQSESEIVQNTFVLNGGGVAFHDEAKAEVRGNIVANNGVAFLFATKSQTTLAFNALHGNEANYLREGARPVVFPERAGQSDITSAPHFVNSETGDFRLQADSPLLRIGDFPFLGALPPIPSIH
ncbi:MAG: nitrous oxide reductase family maturation protein NosD [Nitrospirales bacterium]